MGIQTLGIVAAALVSLLSPGPTVRADDEGQQLAGLVEKRADCVCSVRTTLRLTMKGQSPSSDTPMTLQGAVVQPNGLVMVSNLSFSPQRAMEVMGMGRGEMGDFKYTPTQIKVQFAGDDKEYAAFLAATDTNLDLAFLQIEGAGDKKFPFVDFSAGAVLASGQKVVSVNRLQKGFDYAPYFQTGRVSGQVFKPRRAYTLDGAVSGLGLPVYAITGEPVGVLSTVAATATDEANAAGMGFNMFVKMMTGGGSNIAFVLPAATVKGVVDQAAKRAAEVAAEREAKRKSGKPVEEPSTPVPAGKPAAKPAPPGKKSG